MNITIEETNSWNKYLLLLNKEETDIYFTEEYVKLYESNEAEAKCFVYKVGQKVFLFPYLKRRIITKILSEQYYDLESQYGYGGPISNTDDKNFQHLAIKEFYNFCVNENIVCGFFRFHPLLKNHNIFNGLGNIYFDRKTVIIDLTLSLDEIWNSQIHQKHRNEIRKAEKSGIEFIIDRDFVNLNSFITLYNKRMSKLGAASYYFFDESYYYNIKLNLRQNSFLGIAKLNEEIISAAIFLNFGIYGHYHLSASNENYLKYYPNQFLIYNTALYFKEIGVKKFHLGGGRTTDTNDSLLKFKNRFSKSLCDFYIGKFTFNKDIYDILIKDWEEKYPSKVLEYKDYFTRYRL
jgi:hypothetical protein